MRRTLASFAAIVSLLSTSRVSAQTGSTRVTVPSPTAASLGKFGDIPVSLYTGVPEISVPLFTVKGRTVELPITLRYYASGIRVEDIASWVGLGWSLEAGGVITRTVRGLADDKASVGYYFTGNTWYSTSNWPTISNWTTAQQISNGTVDGDPDQFFFSFAGRSGQFVFGPVDAVSTIEYRTIPSQKLRIVPTWGSWGIQSWEITTEDGTRYTFAATEVHWDNTFGSVPTSGERNNSSWYLTQIVAPGGDGAALYYTAYSARHRLGWYHEEFSDNYGVSGACAPAFYDLTNEYLYDPAQRLDSIRTAAYTVKFVSDPVLRADALAPDNSRQEPRLDHITVTTPTGKVLRIFQLTHDYYPGNRLRLLSVAEQDSAGVSLPPYKFIYDGQTLPPRTSYAQDHWGYYNGKTGNTTYIPTLVYTSGTPPSSVVFPGADRSPNGAFMQAGILTRISYPTGGYNDFIYEANDYGVIGDGTPMLQEVTRSANTFSAPYEGLHSTTFTIAGSPYSPVAVHVGLQMYVHTQLSPCANGDPIQPCPWGEIVGVGKWYPGTPPYTAGVGYNKDVDIALTPGTSYTLQTSAAGQNVDININAVWKELVPVTTKTAGGLRVAEVHAADGRGNTMIHKYQYVLQSDPATSSGVIGAEPKYDFVYAANNCHFYSRASTSKIPLGSGSIGEVAYREVTELHGTRGEFGKTRHTFRSISEWPDGRLTTALWPFATRTSYAWERGQPITTEQYDSLGLLQRKVFASYSTDALGPVAARRLHAMSLYTHNTTATESATLYNAYEVVAGWLYQSGETITQYDTTGATPVSTTKTFVYGNPNHLQLTEVDETNSDGTQRITRMKYPLDYAPATGTPSPEAAAITAMQSTAHIQNAVIERWVIKRGGGLDSVMTAELNTFKQYATGQYLPYQRFVLNNPTPLP